MDKVEMGRKAEDLAIKHLLQQGFRIVERNCRFPQGEIDIVAEDGAYLVFIEVRSRGNTAFGLPQETVNWTKRQRLRKLASAYLQRKNDWERPCRFDCVWVLFDEKGEMKEIELLRDAF
ncbi:MAG: YraN family protein [Peptococcaceae bacterium]|nr:YraN family protein [Peptococcaceae bacterium]MDH7525697.1 YraN family protein [Peptococcaceae bacterium]